MPRVLAVGGASGTTLANHYALDYTNEARRYSAALGLLSGHKGFQCLSISFRGYRRDFRVSGRLGL